MKAFYHIFFYLAFKFSKTFRDDFGATIVAAVIISVVESFYLTWIFKIFSVLGSISKKIIIIIFFLLLLINAAYFLYKQRYREIVDKFNKNNPNFIWKSAIILIILFGIIAVPLIA